jgi:hypothetical protein
MEIDFTILFIVISICVTGMILGSNWMKTGRTAHESVIKSEKYWEKYAKELESACDDYEKEIKSMHGKLAQKDQAPQFKGELTKDNFGEMISGFFPMFADKIPPYLQPFFKNPMIQKFVIDWALKNPDQAMGFFSKFFSKGLGRPSSSQPEAEAIPPNSEMF